MSSSALNLDDVVVVLTLMLVGALLRVSKTEAYDPLIILIAFESHQVDKAWLLL